MIRIRDTLCGEEVRFHGVQSKEDLREVRDFIRDSGSLALDTESTGINSYRIGWKLRTVQWGNDCDSYVVPARWRTFISWAIKQPTKLIGHNGSHDIRSIDCYLGYDTGVVMAGETYIPAHHVDSRGRDEGGTGHKLEELAKTYVDRNAGKWDAARKEAFKTITIPIPGEVFKSGPRKGLPKVRKAKLSEGWALISWDHPAMVAYAAADPLLTYRLWRKMQPAVREYYELYHFDKEVARACDELQRRALLLDVDYTERLDHAYEKKAKELRAVALEYGCENIQSGDQIAAALITLGATLRIKTENGKYKTDAELLRKLAKHPKTNEGVRSFIRVVLGAKQLEKRRETYTEHCLAERDENDRVHPSINSLKARTTRMSVSGPALQQLPTKDHQGDIDD